MTTGLPPRSRTYTTTADFSGGVLTAISTAVPDQLSNKTILAAYDVVWVSNSSKGTVVKLDPETGRVLGVSGTPVDENAVRESAQHIVLPGFIDLHVHGGGGRDIMEGADAALHVAQCHAAHGTTAMLATTMTAPLADLEAAFVFTRADLAQRLVTAEVLQDDMQFADLRRVLDGMWVRRLQHLQDDLIQRAATDPAALAQWREVDAHRRRRLQALSLAR